MSGPPPWTTIGFMPTYFSSTTSRANSSRSAASSIAAPPYLMTTVFPWNSLMYGSASSSVPTSRIGDSPVRVGLEMRTQGKLDQEAGSVACSARVLADRRSRRSPIGRTPIHRSHAFSCRVVGIDAHVLVREVGEEDL